MPYHSSLEIANEFLLRAQREERSLTQMHLQKLVYLAHGWCLAVTGKPLIEDPFEAWAYGPVIRRLYSALRRYGSGGVERLIRRDDDLLYAHGEHEGSEELADVAPTDQAVIDRVWEQYKDFEAFQLSALTHSQNSPWERTYASGVGKSRVISDTAIWDHFTEMAASHG